MRNQWCCEQIDNIAKKCDIHPDTVAEIKKRNAFVDTQPEFSVLSTEALRPLIREKDSVVKAKAIEAVKKLSESGKNPSGQYSKSFRVIN